MIRLGNFIALVIVLFLFIAFAVPALWNHGSSKALNMAVSIGVVLAIWLIFTVLDLIQVVRRQPDGTDW